MPWDAILREVQQLYKVSDRLNVLDGRTSRRYQKHSSSSESVRNTATLLEVLGRDENGADLRIRSSQACPLLAGKERSQATPRPK